MKQISRLFMCVLAMASVFACQPAVDPVPEPDKPGEEKPEPEKPGADDPSTVEVTFSATTESLAEWVKGDKITVFDGQSVLSGVNFEADGVTAKFKLSVAKDAKGYSAFFPEVSVIDATSAESELSQEQALEPVRLPMMAKSSSSRLFFRNLTASVKATIDMDGAAVVKFTAVGAKIAGHFKVDYSGEDPVVASASEDGVALKGDIARGTEISIAVLPAALQGYQLSVLNAAGEEIAFVESSEACELAVAGTLDLGVVKSTKELPKVYKVSTAWIYGGTGAGYNCSHVYNLFDLGDRQYVFDGPEGHGIECFKDDYIEIWNDGTVNVYAGEDGKHWWMAVSQRLDPKGFKWLSVADKYAFLPKNHGSAEFGENGAVTFTLDDGQTTSEASIVMPGEVVLFDGENPQTHVPVTVTLITEKMALRYDNKNYKDFWSPAGNDYDVFYSHPTSLIYELEQMPEGFRVPEAAKTVDETFYDEPDYPAGTDYDYKTLPGTYTLNEYKVLGGSGDDPAFVGVTEKKWCWNNSYSALEDDQLEISVTKMEGTKAEGKTNYGPGADGKYWDYIWNGTTNTGKDLSEIYDRLPKGEISYTFDAATRTITFDGGKTATLLVPGDYQFTQGNKSLTIKPNEIGIQFDIMDMIDATPERWSDVDRFINAPILYVMMFTKN